MVKQLEHFSQQTIDSELSTGSEENALLAIAATTFPETYNNAVIPQARKFSIENNISYRLSLLLITFTFFIALGIVNPVHAAGFTDTTESKTVTTPTPKPTETPTPNHLPESSSKPAISESLLKSVIGEELYDEYAKQGGHLLEKVNSIIPVTIAKLDTYTINVYASAHSGELSQKTEQLLDELESTSLDHDPRFGKVVISKNGDQVSVFDALDATKVLLQFVLPAGEAVQATGAVTVTADSAGTIFTFEGLRPRNNKTPTKNNEKQLLVLHQHQTAGLEAGNQHLKPDQNKLLKMLLGATVEWVTVPKSESIVVGQGMVFILESHNEVQNITLLSGPLVLEHHGLHTLPLIYPSHFELPTSELIASVDTFWAPANGSVDISNAKLQSLQIEKIEFTNEATVSGDLTLDTQMQLTLVKDNTKFTIAGSATLLLPPSGGSEAKLSVMPGVLGSSLLLQNVEKIGPEKPTPSAEQKEKQLQEKIEKLSPQDKLVFQFVHELISHTEVKIALKNLSAKEVYDWLVKNIDTGGAAGVAGDPLFDGRFIVDQTNWEGVWAKRIIFTTVAGKPVVILLRNPDAAFKISDKTKAFFNSLQSPVIVSDSESSSNAVFANAAAEKMISVDTKGFSGIKESELVGDQKIMYSFLSKLNSFQDMNVVSVSVGNEKILVANLNQENFVKWAKTKPVRIFINAKKSNQMHFLVSVENGKVILMKDPDNYSNYIVSGGLYDFLEANKGLVSFPDAE